MHRHRELSFVYAITLAGMAAPALLLFVLVRLLTPGAYGQLAAVQGLAVFLGVLSDFGLIYSGSAAVAGAREDPARLGATVAAGLGLRSLATTLAALLTYALLAANPLVRSAGGLPLLGALLTLAYGFSPAWLLWGLDRQLGLALAEHAPRVLFLFLVLGAAALGSLSPAAVLGLQVLVVIGVHAILWTRVWPRFSLRRPRWEVFAALARDSLKLFLYRFLAAGFVNLNPYLLGLAAPAEAVGGFAAAERVVRAGLSLTEPLLRYHLPKLEGGEDRRKRQLYLQLAALSAGLFLFLQILVGPFLGLLLGSRFAALRGLGPVFTLLSVLLLLHPQSKARLLAGVFVHGAAGRALAVQVAGLGAYALGAFLLYTGGRLRPLSLAGLVVGVEALILLLAFRLDRRQSAQDG